MSEDAAPRNAVATKVGKTVALALLMGLPIAVIGAGSWVVLAQWNARWHPEAPWAAAIMACGLLAALIWLGGFGWPRSTSAFRKHHLRVWRPESGAWSGDNLVAILGLICALVALSVIWIFMETGHPPVDVSPYPTTAFRFSVLIMGAVVSGVVEEAAFRGYMQSHLERIGPTFAILITSAVFTLLHAYHGIEYLLAIAPGFFFASVIYGYLALKSGSIVPGMALHAAGDGAHTFFVLLGGNASLLFAD